MMNGELLPTIRLINKERRQEELDNCVSTILSLIVYKVIYTL